MSSWPSHRRGAVGELYHHSRPSGRQPPDTAGLPTDFTAQRRGDLVVVTKLMLMPKLPFRDDTGQRLVIAVGFLEGPGAAGVPVDVLDVAQSPPDLGRRIGLPVRACAGHLAARQRLRDAVRAAGVFRVVAPAALPVPDVLQAAEIGLRAEAEAGHDAVGSGLRRARVGRRGRDVDDTATATDLVPDRIGVAGDSVGGNMTAAIAIMSKQRGGPRIAGQLLYYPVTDASFDSGSYHQFATGYWLRRDAMQWFWDQYTTDSAQRAEVTASPLRASLDELSGLPRALVINGEADVLRDEGEAYAARLRAAGVPVTSVRYNGTIHDFVMLNALRDSNTDKAATAQGGEFLRAVLWDE